MEETKTEFLKIVYLKVKNFFDGEISTTSWIWVDYFKDEESGFQEFLSRFKADPDYRDFVEPIEEIDEVAFDIASDIHEKLFRGSFIQMCGQIALSK